MAGRMMLLFDNKRRFYSLVINWMGKQLKIPMFMVGPREHWSPN
jgi:hypothetical protein